MLLLLLCLQNSYTFSYKKTLLIQPISQPVQFFIILLRLHGRMNQLPYLILKEINASYS